MRMFWLPDLGASRLKLPQCFSPIDQQLSFRRKLPMQRRSARFSERDGFREFGPTCADDPPI